MTAHEQTKDEMIARFRHKIAELESSKKQLKAAKEEIIANEEKLRVLIENSPDYIMNVAADGTILYINRNALGLSIQQIVGKNIYDLTDSTYTNELKLALENVFTCGEADNLESSITLRNGKTLWFETRFTALKLKDGSFVAMLIISNVTERKRALAALAESENRYRMIAENVKDVIWTMDIGMNLTYATPSIMHLLGYNHNEFTSLNLKDILKPDTLEAISIMINERISRKRSGQRQSLTIELELLHKNGSIIWSEQIINFMYDDSDNVIGIIGVARNITERKLAEEALKKSEAGLRMAQKMAHLGSWEWDLGSNKTIVSDEMLSIYGLPEGINNIDSQVFAEMIHPEDRDYVYNTLITNFSSNFPVQSITYRIIRPDGEVRWLWTIETKMMEESSEGKPKILLGAVQDITERMQAEETLRKSEADLKMAQQMAHVGSWEWDLANGRLKLSDELYNIYGIQKTDNRIDPIELLHGVVHPEDREGLLEKILEYVGVETTGKPFPYRIIRPDGETRWVCAMNHYIKRYGATDMPEVIVGVIQDITDRMEIENDLRIKEQAISSSINGITITDMKGNFIYTNESLARMWGYTKEEMLGRHTNDFNYDPEMTWVVQRALLKSGHYQGELTAKKKDGTPFYIFLSASVVKDAKDKPFCMMGSVLDITERKQMEKQLKEYSGHLEELVEDRTAELKLAKDMAEMANKAKSKFLASMSHELRTPLNSIIGFARLMKMGYFPEEYESNLSNIISSSEHLVNLVNDVLDLSRIEAGKMKFEMEPVLMHDLLNKCLQTVKPGADKKEVIIEYSTESPGSRIFGDRRWLQQIFLNLLNNAIKFSNRPGRVRLETKESKGTFYTRISDTGIGIGKQDLDLIFDEFHQVHPAGLDGIAEGTGLGLPITKKLVEAHSGEIYAESEPGKGTIFTVLLPGIRFADADKSRESNKKLNLALAIDKYVLIVDDKKENRDLLCSFFKKYGQKHLTAESGINSIELMGKHNDIGLILMDIKMTEMSGTEAMKIIKSKFKVPVVAVTAFAMDGDCENLLQEGFDDYIPKPIDIDLLGKKVLHWLKE